MNEKRVGDYVFIEKIGKGGQATVWKGVDQNSNFVAIKKMSVGSGDDNTKSYEREVAIMKLVKHPYLVQSLGSFKENQYFYLVYEFCPCDLLSLLQKQPSNRFPEQVAQKWVRQITEVMAHLNNCKIIHRDLKPENILLTEENFNADIRLADFGLARQGLTTRSFVGTLEYASPEIKNCQEYSYNTDVWSLGVIFYAAIFGKLPILQGQRLVYPPNAPEISYLSKEFIEACLTFDYRNRPNFDDLLQHPYLKKESQKFKPIVEELKIIEEPLKIVEAPIIAPEIPEEIEKLPETKREIEEFLIETYFNSIDVMDFVDRSGEQMKFLRYFVAKHYTERFKFFLDNLMNSRCLQEFGQDFFEDFFFKSEKVCNVLNQLEKEYMGLTSDDYSAFTFQIEELVVSNRESTPGYILVVLQKISEKLRRNIREG